MMRSIDCKQLLIRRLPIIQWLPKYTFATLLSDLLAGITVGLTEIPQAIAYAGVAGLSSEYGLYSSFMGCFTYFLLGSAKDVNIGPTAIMALMVHDHVEKMGPDMAVLICFLSGCIIFFLGILQLGFLIDFFSYPVISGFTCAAATNIAFTQVNSLLGISHKADSFLDALQDIFTLITDAQVPDLSLGLGTMVFLFAAREIRRFGSLQSRPEWTCQRNALAKCIFLFSICRNAVAVIFGALLAYILSDEDGKTPFRITGTVPGGLPSLDLPPFSTNYNGAHYTFMDMIRNFGGIVAFCPLIALLEHMAIAKAFSKGKILDATQEMWALGISNILSSLFHSMPITGSFTRTAVNNASGVKTTGAGVISGIMVLFALGFLTSAFTYIPKATLAAVIIVAMFYLFEFETFAVLYRTKRLDFIPFLVTLLCCLFISLEYGILIGIGVNLMFILYANARPKLLITKEKLSMGDVFLVHSKTALHYMAAEYVRETILKECSTDPKCAIVFDGKPVGNIDVTVAKAVSDLNTDLRIRNQELYLWNWKPALKYICLGINPNLDNYFIDCDHIEDIFTRSVNTTRVIVGNINNSDILDDDSTITVHSNQS